MSLEKNSDDAVEMYIVFEALEASVVLTIEGKSESRFLPEPSIWTLECKG